MACSYEQIEVSGLSHPTLTPNGVYVKKDPIFAVPIVYEKDAGGGTYYRIWGPLPFAGNTFLLQYYPFPVSGNNITFANSAPNSSAVCPDLLTGWTNQDSTTGTVLITPPAPSQNTFGFGLPADVVALITSRFGSVANFLRLRNQGQV